MIIKWINTIAQFLQKMGSQRIELFLFKHKQTPKTLEERMMGPNVKGQSETDFRV